MAANMIQNEEIERALQRLRDVLKNTAENNRLCIAYSGGLDSRFLAFFASKCGLKVELLHASAAHVSPSESQNAVDRGQGRAACRRSGAGHGLDCSCGASAFAVT